MNGRSNERRIRAWLACAGEASRADLARQLELPKATVAGIVTDLIDRGAIAEAPRARPDGTPGRPAHVLTLTGAPSVVAALTWSAGRLRISLATLSGRVLAEHTSSVEPEMAQSDVISLILGSLGGAARSAGENMGAPAAIVLSMPAPIQRGHSPLPAAPGGGKRGQWMPAWLDEGLAGGLAQRTGRPVLLENDANLGALGEYMFGAGRGEPHQIYLKLGRQSVGAGLIIGGQLYRGSTGLAGELAHVQVRDDGPMCVCGGRGCLIRTVSTEMIDLAQPAYTEPLTLASMLSLAEAGDIGLQRLLADLGRSIGRPLADACTLLNPGLFVLDGSIGPAGKHILGGIAESIDRHAQPATSAAARVITGTLGPDAEVLGAVVLVQQDLDQLQVTPVP